MQGSQALVCEIFALYSLVTLPPSCASRDVRVKVVLAVAQCEPAWPGLAGRFIHTLAPRQSGPDH